MSGSIDRACTFYTSFCFVFIFNIILATLLVRANTSGSTGHQALLLTLSLSKLCGGLGFLESHLALRCDNILYVTATLRELIIYASLENTEHNSCDSSCEDTIWDGYLKDSCLRGECEIFCEGSICWIILSDQCARRKGLAPASISVCHQPSAII